jgi:ketosteroid isomerase-like protein
VRETDPVTAVQQTIARYAHAVDHGRFEDAAACFTDDGVLDVVGGTRSAGRAAIAERFAAAGRALASTASEAFVRHHVSSVQVTVDGDLAVARSYFLVLTEIGVDHWGSYHDRLRPDGDVWLFTERRVRVEGRIGPSRMT